MEENINYNNTQSLEIVSNITERISLGEKQVFSLLNEASDLLNVEKFTFEGSGHVYILAGGYIRDLV